MRLLVAALVVVCLAGCTQSVPINSDPQGATVKVNGEVVGTTPFVYEADRAGNHVDMLFEKPGFRTQLTGMSKGYVASLSGRVWPKRFDVKLWPEGGTATAAAPVIPPE